MRFVFLHPDFFWIIPPVLVLFFFWMTQKSHEYSWLDEKIVEKLRVKSDTLSLQARNALFSVAALLMIISMAEPVLYDPKNNKSGLKLLLVLDLSPDKIETSKKINREILKNLENDDVALASYSSLISPPTRQYGFLEQLIAKAPQEVRRTTSDEILKKFAKKYQFDKVVISSDITLIKPSESALKEESKKILEEIKRQKQKNCYRYHIPLFPYPLGFALLLILAALSSKSMRKSVPVEVFLVFVLLGGNVPSDASVFDYKLLKDANDAYEQGEYRISLEKFCTYQQLHDSPQVRYNIANVYYRLKNYEAAIKWYKQVGSDDPVLIKYRNENLQSALGKMKMKSRPDLSQKTKSVSNQTSASQKEKASFRLYPLNLFVD